MNLVITFDEIGKLGPPFDVPEYRKSYKEFSDACADKNIKVYFSRGQESYQRDNVFINCWTYKNGELLQINSPVVADIIYVKSRNIRFDDDAKYINNLELEKICTDKIETYNHFKEYSPKTFLINDSNELKTKLELIDTKKVVIKPRDGSKGRDVFITDKENIDYNQSYPVLLQEFIDSSVGIEGIFDGLHELRLIIFGNKIQIAILRIPAKGLLTANVALGGTMKIIPIGNIPDDVKRIFEYVDTKLKKFGPRIYSIDVVNSPSGYKIIELNAQPGLHSVEWSNEFKTYQENLCNYLVVSSLKM